MAHHGTDGHVVARGVGRAASVALEHRVIVQLERHPTKVEERGVQRAPVWLGSKS